MPGVQTVTLTHGLLGYEPDEQSEPFTVTLSTLADGEGGGLLGDVDGALEPPPPQPVTNARSKKGNNSLLDLIDVYS